MQTVQLSSFVEQHLDEFLSSGKSQLAIFWLDEACFGVLHSKTILEEDVDRTDFTKYEFQHYNEWGRRPQGIYGNYKDYPRGRIFFQDGKYQVEITDVQESAQIESFIRKYFMLPGDTVFKYGYW